MRRAALLLLVAPLLAACGGGSTTAAPPSASATRTLAAPSPLGSPVAVSEPTLGSGTVTLLSVTEHATGATPSDPAPSHGTYVVIHVRETGGPLLSTPNAWVVFVGAIGPLGTETLQGTAPTSGWVTATTQLPTSQLAAGQSAEGDVVFDVAGPHGSVVYDEGGPAERSWRF